ncbi:hypothetical protein M569_13160 [Genlisea aurea]|uniref:BHLH domain-containing protein n=1 Tax=Genlisea aurea TaxID=192259 RepID=S8C425_9LAMI|nr:hypothetical protein M569_13160 [Genlisea aurea]
MGSKQRFFSDAAGRLRKRSRRVCLRRRRLLRCRRNGEASVSDKLETLRDLIPSRDPEANPDRLFQETADYIVLLKTQVLVLKKLIDSCTLPGNCRSSGAL